MSDLKVFESLEEGDRILFNDKKYSLKVVENRGDSVLVEGPEGGEYVIFRSETGLSVSDRGSRYFASKVEDLRKVGVWKRVSDTEWKHTGEGCEVEIFRNSAGFWSLKFSGWEPSEGLPGYGFTSMEFAVEAVEKILRKHPQPG